MRSRVAREVDIRTVHFITVAPGCFRCRCTVRYRCASDISIGVLLYSVIRVKESRMRCTFERAKNVPVHNAANLLGGWSGALL